MASFVTANSHDLFVMTEGPGIYESIDHGDTWTALNHQDFFGDLLRDPIDPDEFLVATIRGPNGVPTGGVWASLDGAHTFVELGLDGRVCSNLALNPLTRRLFVAVYGSGIWVIDLA